MSSMSVSNLMSSSIYNYIDHELETIEDNLENTEREIAKNLQPVYKKVLFHPSLRNWLKWAILFLIFRVQNPVQWANFLSLNKPIRQILTHYKSRIIKLLSYIKRLDSKTPNLQLFIQYFSNLSTCVFLYLASVNNDLVPKDYFAVDFLSTYYGNLNPPLKSQILVTPRFSKYSKLSHYKSSRYYKQIRAIYDHKEYIIFPILYAQLLSNYLTPTKYKLNQRYFSPFIKRNFFNPIWINFSMGVNYNRMDWFNLASTYALQNIVLLVVIAGYNFKEKILDKFYEMKHGKRSKDEEVPILKNFVVYCAHRSNSILNFIYCPNLISILLIALTARVFKMLTPLSGHYQANMLQTYYLRNKKTFFKTYTKLIGFVAGFLTLSLNSFNLIPDVGYTKPNKRKAEDGYNVSDDDYDVYDNDYDDDEDDDDDNKIDNHNRYFNKVNEERKKDATNPPLRLISKEFLSSLDLYLFQVILLSKWRIIKSFHPFFSKVKLKTYNRIETILMCFGFFKYMNLNDFINKTKMADDRERIAGDYTIKAANYVT